MLGFKAVSNVPRPTDILELFEGRRRCILSLIVIILSLKRLIKSLLLTVIGMLDSIELWLSTGLSTVLKRTVLIFLY